MWFFCDPMFPQLFQRFFSAKNDRSIARTMLLYPLVCTVVFFMPIAVGVLGRLSFPDLAGKQADRILPVVWVMLVTFGTYLAVHGLLSWREKSLRLGFPAWLQNIYFWLLAGIFLLAMDFWAWGEAEPTLAGIPLWVGYFIVLSALQTGVMLRLTRPSKG